MPAVNPYDFSGMLGGGGLSLSNLPGMQPLSGAGANPYGGMLGLLQAQRKEAEQRIQRNAADRLRSILQSMPRQPQLQPGMLENYTSYAPPGPPPNSSLDTDKVPLAFDPSKVTTEDSSFYDPASYYTNLSRAESADNDTAVNEKSGATGRFQFIMPTWRSIMRQAPQLELTEDGRTDRGQQWRAVQYLTKQNAGLLQKDLGRMPTHTELYLAHLLGPGWASAVLRAPDTQVQALVPQSFVDANPFLRGIDGRKLLQLFGPRFNR
jgi:hypothetical protein